MKAIVLRKTIFGESDFVLQFLLETGESRSFFAAGARRSNKRFPHRFDMSGIYDIDWRDSLGAERLMPLTRADLIDHAIELTGNIERWTRWLLIMEWLSYQETHGIGFQELVQLRSDLTFSSVAGLSFHRFVLDQIRAHGLTPDWDECVVCHEVIHGRREFVMSLTGVSHRGCHHGLPLSEDSMAFLKSNMADLESVEKKEIIIDELDQITFPYLSMQLGRALKAQSFFEQLKNPDLSFGSNQDSPLCS